MALMRSVLLKAAQNRWLAQHLPHYPFARRAVRRFMPGEDVQDALRECAVLQERQMGTVLTRLGENITSVAEAAAVTAHYVELLGTIRQQGLATHASVKLTQLGLDIAPEHAIANVKTLMSAAGVDPVWIDMESSPYTDVTLTVFRAARAANSNVGLCLQSYLRRTSKDLDELLGSTTAIRLVKGAYKEPAEIAFPRKADVDANYFKCAEQMLDRVKQGAVGWVPVIATHDVALIRKIAATAEQQGIDRQQYEFHLLYGINTAEQMRLAREGYRLRVLISYGAAWFAWYMRRLAERPANVLFLLKSLV